MDPPVVSFPLTTVTTCGALTVQWQLISGGKVPFAHLLSRMNF